MDDEAKRGSLWCGNNVIKYGQRLQQFLNRMSFEEKKRVLTAIISPEAGGRVYIRYQKPADVLDAAELLALNPAELDKPQPDAPKYIDARFDIDLERTKAIINGLAKAELLDKRHPDRIAAGI